MHRPALAALIPLLGLALVGTPVPGLTEQVRSPAVGGEANDPDSALDFRGRVVDHATGEPRYGAEGTRGSRAPTLVDVVFGDWVRLGGIEVGGLVEVVGNGFLDDLI